MITFSTLHTLFAREFSGARIGVASEVWIRRSAGGIFLCILALSGCQEPPVINAQSERHEESKSSAQTVEEFKLQSGDTIKVSFPSAPNLDTSQQIRSDGKITLPMVGEVAASGKTPVGLEKELVAQYSSQLVSKEVSVTVVSAPF